MTKGDNVPHDDFLLYPKKQKFATREDVVGLVRASVPLIGWPFIRVNELLSRPTKYSL